jgi:hypothetical protein
MAQPYRDLWYQQAQAQGVTADLAAIGRQVLCERHQIGKPSDRLGAEDEGQAMIKMCLHNPVAAQELFEFELKTIQSSSHAPELTSSLVAGVHSVAARRTSARLPVACPFCNVPADEPCRDWYGYPRAVAHPERVRQVQTEAES